MKSDHSQDPAAGPDFPDSPLNIPENQERDLPEGMVPGYPEAAAAIDAEERVSTRKGKWKRGLTALILSTAAAILAAEMYLRLSDYRQDVFDSTVNATIERWAGLMQAGIFEEVDDPVRRYAMRPGAEVEIDGWSFRVNSARARGPELASPKPAGERRLLALGDSFCFGLWSDEDETLVGHLTRMANEREEQLGSGLNWRAVNLGVPGYHSGQQLLAFEQEGLELEPDAVVIYYNTNDIETNGFFLDETFGLRNDFLPLPVWLRRKLWGSHLYGAIARWHYQNYQSVDGTGNKSGVPKAHANKGNQESTADSLRRVVELCRERDLPVYFVNQPLLTWMGDMMNPEWPIIPLVEWAEDLRVELEIPGTNLLGWTRGYADGVDRQAAVAPGEAIPAREFIVDKYYADPWAETALQWVRDRARSEGTDWDSLTFDQQLKSFGGYPVKAPAFLDFHLDGAGYGHLARVIYPGMRAAGILP